MQRYQAGEVMVAVMLVMMITMVGFGRMGMGHGGEHAWQSGDAARQTAIDPATSAVPGVR